MDLKTVLTKDTICLHLKGTNKQEIISELLGILVAAGKVKDQKAALDAIMEREQKMSTGMKHGIAIPHGKTSTVDDLVACVGVSDNPVDFDSLDGELCRIFIMTLSPLEKTGPHLQFLAEVSLLFKSSEKRAQIIKAQSPDEVLQILAD
jgi:PTS system nitrogen regulatory IIA component